MAFIESNGNVGIGTTDPDNQSKLHIVYDPSPVSGTTRGGYFHHYPVINADRTVHSYGIEFSVREDVNDTKKNSGYACGILGECFLSGKGELASAYGLFLSYGLYGGDADSGSVVTNGYGLFLQRYVSAGSMTNGYDIYIPSPVGSAPTGTNWCIYSNNNADSALAGGLSIGSTSAPNEKLEVAGKIRANTAFNINGTDGVSGSFTTADSKTVTVTGGIITSIV